jgi:hypothetical protein
MLSSKEENMNKTGLLILTISLTLLGCKFGGKLRVVKPLEETGKTVVVGHIIDIEAKSIKGARLALT